MNLKIILPALMFLVAAIAVFIAMTIDTTGKKGSGLGETFTYDLDQLKKIDPDLILYEPVKSFNCGMKAPVAITVENEIIYIAGDQKVAGFDENGGKIMEFSLNDNPTCLTVKGNAFFVGIQDQIVEFDSQGKEASRWERLGEKATLTAVIITDEKSYVADAGQRQVWIYNEDHQLAGQLDRSDQGSGRFVIPSPHFDMVMGPDNQLHVVNPGAHHIETYENDVMTGFWGTPSSAIEGFCGCCNPIHLSLTKEGHFVTCEKGLTRIKVYDSNGQFLGAVAGAEQFKEHDLKVNEKRADSPYYGLDIAVDGKNRVLVLDPCTGRITFFRKK